MLKLRKPWARQPPQNAEIAHRWLDRGLQFCIWGGNNWNPVTGKFSTLVNAPGSGVNADGRGVELLASQYLYEPNTAISQTATFIASVSFKTTNTDNSILGFGGSGTSRLLLYKNSLAKLCMFSGAASTAQAGGTTSLVANRTYRVAGRVNGAASRQCFIDGVQDGTNSTSVTVGASECIVAGAYYFNGAPFATFYGNQIMPFGAVFNTALTDSEIAELSRPGAWALWEPQRIWVPQTAAAGGASTADVAVTGAAGAFSGTAQSVSSAALAATGDAGTFAASAASPAVAALAATGASGAISAAANSATTATLAVTGGAGEFAGSAGSGTSAAVAITGDSGAFSASATAPASVALAALGGEGAFAGSAYPLTSAQVAALGASGAFSGLASTVGTASVSATGGDGIFVGTANSTTTAALAAVGGAGTFAGSASVAGSAPDLAEYLRFNSYITPAVGLESYITPAVTLASPIDLEPLA